MTSAQIIIVVTIVLYLAAMVFVGVYFGKKGSGSSSDDFYLGGRKHGPRRHGHERRGERYEQLSA